MRYLILFSFLAGYLNSFSQLTVSITSYTDASCFGNCDGTATSSVTGGIPPYSYGWNTIPVQNGATAIGLCTGAYMVIVTDSVGTMDSVSVNINQPAPIATNLISTNPSCNGACDGVVTLTPIGGSPPYSYLWTPSGNTTPMPTGLCAGIYSVIITDANGCVSIDSIMITDPAPFTGNITTVDDTCGLCVGSASVSPIGGAPPYSYLWSPSGDTTQVVTGLCAGNYVCVVTDSNGCFSVFNTTIGFAPGVGCQLGTVNGKVYNDINANCTQDTLEGGLLNVMIQATPGPYYASTNSNGVYSLVLPFGNYTITQILPQYYNEICPVAGSYPVVLDSLNNTINNINFTDTITPVQDLSVNLSSGNIVPGFTCNYYLYYSSLSNIPMNGTVYLVVDDTLTYQYASVIPDVISGDTLFWNYTNLQQFENRSITATFLVPAQVGLLGDSLQACAQISPISGDVNLTNNTVCYDRVVVGSYDPNDKQVEPAGIGASGDILLSQSELTYTIRFQNSGTFLATNIVVIDTLSANLNVTSLRNVMASHPFTYDVSGQGVITFNFNNIMLPDSNTNEPASHGLIMFTIDQHPSNNMGTVIENTAKIYFDFNPAIVTNTVTNTIVIITDIIANENTLNKLNIYPNPSNGKITIDFKLEEANEVSIEVFDIVGKRVSPSVKKKYLSGMHEIKLNISDKNAGIYFMSIQIGTENYLKKIVIQ